MADDRAAKFMEGYVPMPMKALCDDQVEGGAICLFGVLLCHMRQKGFCWPTLDRLAGLMTCSVDTIRRRLKKLEKAQWIRIEKPTRMDSHTYYHLGAMAPASQVLSQLQSCNEPLQICKETVADLQPHLEQEKEYIHNTTCEAGSGEIPSASIDASAGDLQASFDSFWRAYPRRLARQQCWGIWLEIRPDVKTLECMLAAIARAKRSLQWQRKEGQFIPGPKTWLAERRWDDDLPLYDGDRLQKRQQQLQEANSRAQEEKRESWFASGGPTARELLEEEYRRREAARTKPTSERLTPPDASEGHSRDPP